MDSTLYKKLTECNAKSTWPLVRNTVCTQLLGDKPIPVPDLEDAAAYDAGNIVVKDSQTMVDKLKRSAPSAKVVGRMETFVVKEMSTGILRRIHHASKDTEVTPNTAYEFDESDMKHGVKKMVVVQITGCEKWTIDYVPREGDLMLDMSMRGYPNIKKIFLLKDVFYASEINVRVIIGSRSDSYQAKGRIPIAFTLMKFKLDANGIINSETEVDTQKWKVEWTKPSLFRNSKETLPERPKPQLQESPKKRSPNDPLPEPPKKRSPNDPLPETPKKRVFHPRDEMYPLFTRFNQIFFIFYAHIRWLPKAFDSETADLLRAIFKYSAVYRTCSAVLCVPAHKIVPHQIDKN
ncbi:hypothetical protein ACJMK2_032632 [Sinanodonta woodiana]|uniref:Uncharacterized protein n=1 Tax=Sinanodonta woodiana TaxID=1069815 RepID=A0ABD3X5X1_SINWO